MKRALLLAVLIPTLANLVVAPPAVGATPPLDEQAPMVAVEEVGEVGEGNREEVVPLDASKAPATNPEEEVTLNAEGPWELEGDFDLPDGFESTSTDLAADDTQVMLARSGWLSEMRSILNAVGGSHIRLEAYNGYCGSVWSDACASPGVIKVHSNISKYTQARKYWAMTHELAHQYQFNVWTELNKSGQYRSLFNSNPEVLANCMASYRGYSNHGHYCSQAMINWGGNIWKGVVPDVAKPKPVAPKPTYPTVSTRLAFSRVSGADRYETSRKAAASAWSDGPLFVTTGAAFPDALSVGPAVVKENGNLVLSKKHIDQATLSFIKSQPTPERIYIIGGSGAISDDSLNKLGTVAPTTRIGGANRYETSVNVARTFFTSATEAMIATGTNFPDALVASHVGAIKGAPLLVVSNQSNAKTVNQVVRSLGVEKTYIAGGTGAVSQSVGQKATSGTSVTRLSGSDRYDTSRKLEGLIGLTSKQVGVALGTNFPDALSASVVMGKSQSTMVLAPSRCLPRATYNSIKGGATSLLFFGGNQAINFNTPSAMKLCS